MTGRLTGRGGGRDADEEAEDDGGDGAGRRRRRRRRRRFQLDAPHVLDDGAGHLQKPGPIIVTVSVGRMERTRRRFQFGQLRHRVASAVDPTRRR